MNIIDWDTPIETDLDAELYQDFFMTMLASDNIVNWKGIVKKRFSIKNNFKAPSVELRKQISGTAVLIRMGIRKDRLYGMGNIEKGEVLVEMSMNGKASFSTSDFAELNLVVLEAEAAVKSLANG